MRPIGSILAAANDTPPAAKKIIIIVNHLTFAIGMVPTITIPLPYHSYLC